MASSSDVIDYTLIDEVSRLLDKHNWISNFELFYQVIEKIGLTSQKRQNQTDSLKVIKKNNSGIAIRGFSKSNKLFQLSLGISSLHRLTELREPKPTQKIDRRLEFQQLRPPRISGIPGDQSKSIQFTEDTVLEKVEELDTGIDYGNIVEDNLLLDLERETRYIVNTGSEGITSTSLKAVYQNEFTVKVKDYLVSLSREKFQRNLHFNAKILQNEIFETLKHRSSSPLSVNLNEASIIFHPQIIGKIIAFQSNSLISNPPQYIQPVWGQNIYLYDDPLREDGYGSILFDDEGTLTRSKTLMENGRFKDTLDTITTSESNTGGNGYRSSWFRPLNRSYEYPINRSISNLVMTGGIGKGKNFIEKNAISLVVVRGHGYIGGMANNPKFVIHAKETELWKNGDYMGPTYNYTFSGSLNEIMSKGDLSADQVQVVDRAIPGAIYIGWLRCPAGIVKIG